MSDETIKHLKGRVRGALLSQDELERWVCCECLDGWWVAQDVPVLLECPLCGGPLRPGGVIVVPESE